jgi:hypothetical protein
VIIIGMERKTDGQGQTDRWKDNEIERRQINGQTVSTVGDESCDPGCHLD